MRYQLLCVDLDGTLLDDRKCLPEANKKALQEAWRAGMEICIASGRGGESASEYLEQMQIAGNVVALNGGQVLCHGREIFRQAMDCKIVSGMIDLAEETGTRTYFNDGCGTFTLNESPEEIRQRIRQNPKMGKSHWPVSADELRTKLAAGVFSAVKVSVREDDRQQLEHIRQMIQKRIPAGVAKSDVNYLDIFPVGQSKWKGIEKLLLHLKIPAKACICFGDNENDREMLKHAGLGVAMENAGPELKKLADVVTLSNEACGVAHGIYAWALPDQGREPENEKHGGREKVEEKIREEKAGEKKTGEKKMILVSHGKLSEGMFHSIQMIVGEHPDISYMGMLPGEHYQPMVDAVEQQLKEHPDTQYLVVADLLGGSVCNGMTTLTGYPNMKLIAGMNMGLVISLLLTPGALSDEEIDAKINEAKEMNHRVMLKKQEPEKEEDFF